MVLTATLWNGTFQEKVLFACQLKGREELEYEKAA